MFSLKLTQSEILPYFGKGVKAYRQWEAVWISGLLCTFYIVVEAEAPHMSWVSNEERWWKIVFVAHYLPCVRSTKDSSVPSAALKSGCTKTQSRWQVPSHCGCLPHAPGLLMAFSSVGKITLSPLGNLKKTQLVSFTFKNNFVETTSLTKVVKGKLSTVMLRSNQYLLESGPFCS